MDWAGPVAALVAGALGGVVSVIQRINSGKFTLDMTSAARMHSFSEACGR